MVISCSILLRMRDVSDNSWRENKDTFCVQWRCFENRAFCEMMWKKILKSHTSLKWQIWRMRIAWWTRKATNTHSECVILIAFPIQQRLHERTSVLRCKLFVFCFLESRGIHKWTTYGNSGVFKYWIWRFIY